MNLANSQEIRILELAQKIKQLTGSVSPIDFPSLREMLTKTGDGKLKIFREILVCCILNMILFVAGIQIIEGF